MSALEIRPLIAADVAALALQPSQVGQFGAFEPIRDEEHGRQLIDAGPCWTAMEGARVVACAGFMEVFGDRHALCWALLGQLGPLQFRVRRFIAERLAVASYVRIEALARADVAAECRWLELLGFEREGVHRAWGPLNVDHASYSIVRPRGNG